MTDTGERSEPREQLDRIATAIVGGIRPAPGFGQLAVVLAIALIASMAAGIHAIADLPMPVSALGAAGYLWFTIRLRIAIRNGNLFQRGIFAVVLAAVVGSSGLLACAGALELFGPSRVALAGFEASTRTMVPAITGVSTAYSDLADATDALAGKSAVLSHAEATRGGTCGVPTLPVPGPISRMRGDDARIFGEIRDRMRQLSAAATAAKTKALNAKATYALATHDVAKRAFDEAQEAAVAVARSPYLDEVRSTLSTRLEGGVDPQTVQRVVCARDPVLDGIRAVLRLKKPVSPIVAPAPDAPTHRNLVYSITMQLLGALRGDGFDFDTYGLSLIGLLLDLAFHATLRLPARLPPEDPITNSVNRLGLGVGSRAWSAFDMAARNLRENEAVNELRAMLVEVGRWRVTHLIAVPVSEDAAQMRARMALFEKAGQATLLDRGRAGDLLRGARFPRGGEDLEIELYRLTRGFWSKLLGGAAREVPPEPAARRAANN